MTDTPTSARPLPATGTSPGALSSTNVGAPGSASPGAAGTTSIGVPGRSRRIALVDRPWTEHWSALVVTPVAMPDVEDVRAMLRLFVAAHPAVPVACRVDRRSNRWVEVPPGEIEAHVNAMIIEGPDPDPARPEDHMRRFQPPLDSEFPAVAVVGPTSLCLYLSHLVGDATVFTRLAAALVRADLPALEELTRRRAGTGTVFRAVQQQLRPHHRDWIRLARAGVGSPPTPADTSTPADTAVPARSAASGAHDQPRSADMTYTVLSQDSLRRLTRWRNGNARDASVTSLLTVATYLALRQEGLDVDGSSYFTLIDLRRYLPEELQSLPGNLAKAIQLQADLGDPRSVTAAMEAALTTARAVPAAMMGVLPRPQRPARTAGPNSPAPRLTLTFNSMPGLPQVSEMPWLDPKAGRFLGAGYAGAPEAITVFAVRLRHHMELGASFDGSVAAPDAVRRALQAVADDAPGLLGPTA